jgi:predicted HTH transcriptional regulator
MAVVTVWPADSPPVRYKGRIWIRVGPRRDLATAQDERLLNEKRRFRDQPFDARPCGGAEWKDLDLAWYRETYLPMAVAPDVLVALQQLFRNAVMHRTYEHTNAPIRITWYADRLEIFSPGGPVGIVTAETFSQPGFTDYRKPNLAGFLRKQALCNGLAPASPPLGANASAMAIHRRNSWSPTSPSE